jgi:hypothetical protein
MSGVVSVTVAWMVAWRVGAFQTVAGRSFATVGSGPRYGASRHARGTPLEVFASRTA